MGIRDLIYLLGLVAGFAICIVELRKRSTDQKSGEALAVILLVFVVAAVWTIVRAV